MATWRPGKPHRVQGQAGPFAGCPPRSRSAAEMDGRPRQDPAYRRATARDLPTAPGGPSPCTVPGLMPDRFTDVRRRLEARGERAFQGFVKRSDDARLARTA